MKMFQLHIGSNSPDGSISPETQLSIQAAVAKEFPSFSILKGQGFFRGKAEDLLIVKIATDQEPAVFQLASTLRAALAQEGIGIEHDGRYTRVTR